MLRTVRVYIRGRRAPALLCRTPAPRFLAKLGAVKTITLRNESSRPNTLQIFLGSGFTNPLANPRCLPGGYLVQAVLQTLIMELTSNAS